MSIVDKTYVSIYLRSYVRYNYIYMHTYIHTRFSRVYYNYELDLSFVFFFLINFLTYNIDQRNAK